MQHVDEKALFKYLNLGCEMIFILGQLWNFEKNVQKVKFQRKTTLDQRLRDAKITPEKKQKVMKTIWERFTSDDEFYRINETDYKSQFRSRGFRFVSFVLDFISEWNWVSFISRTAVRFWCWWSCKSQIGAIFLKPSTKSRIAQSSIMKLNETSMSKLYDLMLMAVKYQCFHAHHPNEERLSWFN